MKVTILQAGKFSDFGASDHVGAQRLEAGAEVEFPDWYGESLVKAGLAERIGEEAQPAAPVQAAGPAPEATQAKKPMPRSKGRARKSRQ